MTTTSFIGMLLWSNVRIGLLVAIVYGALRVARMGDGAFRHRVWLTTLGGCLLLPLLGAVVPSLPIPILPAPEPGAPVVKAAFIDYEGVSAASFTSSPVMAPGLWLWVYAGGVAGVLGLFLFSVWRMAHLERRIAAWNDPKAIRLKDSLCRELGIRRPVRLLGSSCAGSPFTWRAFKPSVVLPSSASEWSPDRMRNALLHELGHVKRFDWAWLWLLRLVAAIYWFNPFIWIAIRECRFEAERACDDLVLGAGGESSDYAEQLVDLMASCRTSGGVAIALGGSSFPKRIRAILNASQEATVMGRIGKGIVMSSTALLVTVLAACQVTSGQPVRDDNAPSVEQASNEWRLEAAARAQEMARERALEASARRNESEAARERAIVEARASQEAARAQANEQRLAEFAQALEQRTRALRETESQMQRQAEALEQLKMMVDKQNAELRERERALAELQAQLEETAFR